jgi:hypothetical protein
MKYSIVLAALLTSATLFGAELDNTETELQQAQKSVELAQRDANLAQQEAAAAKEALVKAKEENLKIQQEAEAREKELLLEKNKSMTISVTGQGVAPMNTTSPAQAYALAKRAAIADAYRAIAEKVKGVRIDGQDLVKNMMIKRSIVRTSVQAMVRNANVVETTFKEGLCEVEMEIVISYSDFAQ